MIVELRTGLVHRFARREPDPRVAVMACGRLINMPAYVSVVFCPCEYHKQLVAPTLPANQHGCTGCFPDGLGWNAVPVPYARPT